MAGDAALFGDDASDMPRRGLDAAHRTAGHDRRAAAARALSNRRCRQLRFGLAVACRVERAGPGFGDTRQQPRHLRAIDQPGVELVFPRVFEPSPHPAQILGIFSEIHDAAGAKPGLGVDGAVHPLPQPQALDDQRELAGIARHLAAPAPIAARLLAGDVALLAQHHRDAALRQEQGRASADDAAADDHDIGAGRQFLVGWDRIDARRHAVTSAKVRARCEAPSLGLAHARIAESDRPSRSGRLANR